jgi:long-chain acyl-CoA synthetase
MGALLSGARRLGLDALEARAARAASGFESLGVGAGDLVALYLRNDFPVFEASLAAGLLGAYPTPINWHSTPDEAAYVFENSGAKAIVIHADLIEPIRTALPSGAPMLVVPTPPEIAEAYRIDPVAPAEPMTDWSGWLEGFTPYAGGPIPSPGAMIYTSGTTGRPKGVRRLPPSREQAAEIARIRARSFGLTGVFGAPAEIRTVVTGPMYHSAPNSYGLVLARAGATVILQPRFDPEDLLQLIERHRVTHLHMVPIMFHRLLKLPQEVRARYDHASLRFVVHAAAPCPPPIKRAMIDWWGPIIAEYYGSTEVGMATFCHAQDWLAHPGTVGRTIPESVVRIIDEKGQGLPAGQVGEIVARTPAFNDFTYHGDDQKRRDAEKAGLIAPGDIGYFDEDGFLYLCDRANDMIISGGVNIYPAEIEGELLKMPGVADCAVFGIPDEEFGEGVCAVVQPQDGADLDAAAVQAYLRAHIAGFKVPRRVEFSANLPREDSGKIFKRKLRDPFWAGLERRI